MFYLFLKKYILVIALIYSLFGQIVEQFLNLDIGSYVFLLVQYQYGWETLKKKMELKLYRD